MDETLTIDDQRNKKIQRFISQMPSLPTTLTKVLEVCNNPTASPNDLNRVISMDPVLVGKVLRLNRDGTIPADNLVEVSASPAPRIVIEVDADGHETESERAAPPNIAALKDRIWEILEAEGKTLSALNASLFAGDLSDKVGVRILAVRSQLGEKVIRNYSLVKGVAVAINPVPIADLAAAVAVDISMVVHLSNVYGLPMTRSQSGTLIKAISGQLLLLMGATWAVHLASSLLKAGSAGLSTVLTAGAQGAVAYYSTYVVGRAAQQYLAAGCSWGEDGPKQVIKNILDSIDRDSMLANARKDILERIRST